MMSAACAHCDTVLDWHRHDDEAELEHLDDEDSDHEHDEANHHHHHLGFPSNDYHKHQHERREDEDFHQDAGEHEMQGVAKDKAKVMTNAAISATGSTGHHIRIVLASDSCA